MAQPHGYLVHFMYPHLKAKKAANWGNFKGLSYLIEELAGGDHFPCDDLRVSLSLAKKKCERCEL
jgi:hypothetical protein